MANAHPEVQNPILTPLLLIPQILKMLSKIKHGLVTAENFLVVVPRGTGKTLAAIVVTPEVMVGVHLMISLKRFEHTPRNSDLIQGLLEKAPSYCLNVSGEIAGANDGEEVFKALPPNFAKEDKHVIGIYSQNILIGLIDCLISFPSKGKAHIGLLLLDESYQSQGLGKLAYNHLEDYLRNFPAITQIRLAVVKTNNKVLTYWERMGFQLTGEVKTYSNKLITSESLIMEKRLSSSP